MVLLELHLLDWLFMVDCFGILRSGLDCTGLALLVYYSIVVFSFTCCSVRFVFVGRRACGVLFVCGWLCCVVVLLNYLILLC